MIPLQKTPLTGLRADELAELLSSRSRAHAVLRWLYAADPLAAELPEEGAGVARQAWALLHAHCELPKPVLLERSGSPDGTTKWVLGFGDATAETVLIPARGRSTVCISSQAGCTRRCTFCATARLGFTRNLTAAELVAQYRVARAAAAPDAPARNIVFMGMGEPMDNLDEVLRAVELFTQSPAPQLSAAHVTVSTSGVLPGMRRFLQESRAGLALSLNATTDAVRRELMPQTQVWPLEALLELLREDATRNATRLHFIEYVLLRGVNDSDEDASRLVSALRRVRARVNLIPHNPFPGSPFLPSHPERIRAFQATVCASGLRCFIREPRGTEIAAACGQLALTSSRAAAASPAG